MSQEEGRCREGARGGAAPARGGVGERGGALRSTGASGAAFLPPRAAASRRSRSLLPGPGASLPSWRGRKA